VTRRKPPADEPAEWTDEDLAALLAEMAAEAAAEEDLPASPELGTMTDAELWPYVGEWLRRARILEPRRRRRRGPARGGPRRHA